MTNVNTQTMQMKQSINTKFMPSSLFASLFIPFKQFNAMKMMAICQALFLITLWILTPDSILPSPIEIAESWNKLALQNGLLVELTKSAMTIWKAIFYSTIISFGIAFLATANFFKPIAFWLTSLRFLGFAGITFVFTLMTHNGSDLKVSLLTFGMSAFLLTNALSMVNSIKQEQVDYAKTLHMSGYRIMYELAFREKLDEIIDLIRQNAAMGWTLLSMVEGLVRSEGGIGDILINQNKHLHLAAIFAIQITILVYGLLQDYGIQVIRKTLCPYVQYSAGK